MVAFENRNQQQFRAHRIQGDYPVKQLLSLAILAVLSVGPTLGYAQD